MNRSTAVQTPTSRRPQLFRGSIAALALLSVAALTPGCAVLPAAGEPVGSRPASSQSPAPTSPDPTPESSAPQDSDRGADEEAAAPRLRSIAAAATEVTDDYWAEHWTEFFTGSYVAPEVVGVYDGSDPQSAPVCNGEPLEAGNAAYCPAGDYVAWDLGLLTKSTEIGDSFVYLIVSHEWGHAIQERLKPSLVWEEKELQADCLAGATIYGAIDDGTLSLTPEGQKHLVDGLNFIASDLPWTDVGDHGDSFQRIAAFNMGRSGGVNACLAD